MNDFMKVTIMDEGNSFELVVVLFHEILKIWKDRLVVGERLGFVNFVRNVYKDEVQIKNNRSSRIEAFDPSLIIEEAIRSAEDQASQT